MYAPFRRSAVLFAACLAVAAPAARAGGPGGPPPPPHHHPPLFAEGDPELEFLACVTCALAAGYLACDIGEALWYGASSTEEALRGGWGIDPPVASAGRSPFAIALDARVEAPEAEWDVALLRVGLLASSHRDVSGLDLNLLLGYASGDEAALQIGLFNIAEGGFDGLRVGLCNVAGRGSRGVQIAGFFNVDGGAWAVPAGAPGGALSPDGAEPVSTDLCAGLQLAGFGNRSRKFAGAQIAGFANRADGLEGVQLGLVNVAGSFGGAQLGLVNVCDLGAGLQLGLWNQARAFAGVQIGLCNVVSDGPVPFLPLVNASF